MWKVFESSPFLRTLNFLRIRHPDRGRYLWLYPILFTVAVIALLRVSARDFESINISRTIELVLPLVIILLPFFIASLAATATFTGPKDFDHPFKMHEPVKLLIIVKGGCRDVDVTPRHFLSLLFSYVSILCILLLFIGTAQLNLAGQSFVSGAAHTGILKAVFLAFFYLLLGQILVATGVAIYYLGDFIHRLAHRL